MVFLPPIKPWALVLGLGITVSGFSSGTLTNYDEAVTQDAEGGGPEPISKMTTPVTLDGTGTSAFDFGATAGPVTIEFVLEGDPVTGGRDGYLAVGENSVSSLRYEQWDDTGQLGFTQGGVADYTFTPLVLSPTEPTHVTYRWDGDGTMDLFLDGVSVGERSNVNSNFDMPRGNGFLGSNPGGTEGMVGTIHRVTVYDELVGEEVIERHANAFNDVPEPPVIEEFVASPSAFLSPGSTKLTWVVTGDTNLKIGETDVTLLDELIVSPAVTTTYTLTATNDEGSSSTPLTVTVNPAPVISLFEADRSTINSGESATLNWAGDFGTTWSISPGPGDVTAITSAGSGSVPVTPGATTTYTLTATNQNGSTIEELEVRVATVANHLVISEFVADNESGLQDGDGDYSDWIEIFNPTSQAIDLGGYFLSDDPENLTLFPLPNQVLQPGEREIIFASGKGLAGPAGEIHANFRLSRSGEYLGLIAPNGTTILHEFSPTYPALGPDLSYGIVQGDLSTARVLGSPTPGEVNDENLPTPAAVLIGTSSRMFTNSLSVELESPSNGAEIFYTTDGSVPSKTNGSKYSSPVSLQASTYLRAVAVRGDLSGPVSGESYLKLAADLQNYESDLPLMVIDNFGAGAVPAKGWSGTGADVRQRERQSAVWATFDVDANTGEATFSALPQMMSRSGIRGRGAFSSTWREKPYSVEVWDENQEEKDVEVLGMPAHSDWVLYYPDVDRNKDPSMLFNTFMYDLSSRMGRYATRIRWVEAFVNTNGGDLSLADRRGVYAIIEKVSRGEGRLDFERLSEDGTSGGWLLGLNRMDSIPVDGFPAGNGATTPQFFHTKGPNRVSETPANTQGRGDDIPRQGNGYLNFDNPNGYRINSDQRAAIEDWFSEFEDVLYDNNLWKDPLDGYRKYLDAEDFVEYFIFNNLSRNGDGMLISMFPWKGDDGKLRMGPAWDYNWSSYYIGGGSTGTKWHRRDRLWYGRLFNDPDFEQLYIDRWFYHRDRALSNDGIAAIFDDQSDQIGAERAVRQGYASEAAWRGELTRHESWLTARADWYDGQFTERPEFVQEGGEVPRGFLSKFNPPPGVIYYTIDGSDPRLLGGGISTSALQYEGGVIFTNLIKEGDAGRAIVPTSSSPSAGLGWTDPGFNDGGWQSGSTGMGYDRGPGYVDLIGIDVGPEMDGVNGSAYLRVEFDVTNASSYDVMTLRMKYDDGFVAYLNGERIATANAPVSLGWDSEATVSNPDGDAEVFEPFDVSAHVGSLREGTNVLAIHGLNNGTRSSDFLITPELAVGQSAVSGGIEIDRSTLVTARVQVGSQWSAPKSAYFFVETEPADPANLVISEFHYRPVDASAEEVAAGFSDRDDFEFIELLNRGDQEVDLTGVRFIEGIRFDFTEAFPRSIAPGGRLLVVNDLSAFEMRYGSGLRARIAGEYFGNLSNDGETITLVDANDAVILSFTYNDQSPWPESADGDGPSVVLLDPDGADLTRPESWSASETVGGSPGVGEGQTYLSWRIANGLPNPEVDPDPDRDGRENFLEYAQGTDPRQIDSVRESLQLEALTVDGVAGSYLVYRFQRNPLAGDIEITPQISEDLAGWQSGAPNLVFLSKAAIDGTREIVSFRSGSPVGASQTKRFGRIKVISK